MKKSLILVASMVLAASLSGCAHTGGGYGGGGAYFEDCGYDGDCYGGPQYTCVFYEPVPAPARLEIALAFAQRSHATRTLGPRGEIGPAPSPSDSGSSFSSSTSAPSTVSRAPVVPASPAVDRGSPRVPN